MLALANVRRQRPFPKQNDGQTSPDKKDCGLKILNKFWKVLDHLYRPFSKDLE